MYKEHIYSGREPVQQFRFTYTYSMYWRVGVGWSHLNDHHQQHQETNKKNMIHISWLQVLKLNTSLG